MSHTPTAALMLRAAVVCICALVSAGSYNPAALADAPTAAFGRLVVRNFRGMAPYSGTRSGQTVRVPPYGIFVPGSQAYRGLVVYPPMRTARPWQRTPLALRPPVDVISLYYSRVPASHYAYQNPAARYAREAYPRPAEAPAEGEGKGPVQEVIATGSAPAMDGNLEAARKAAISGALRNAVEKVVGVYVAGTTVADKFVALRERVYTRSEGFVVPGEVLEEGVAQGVLTVRMRATVSLRPLLSRLRELGLTREWRVAVAVRDGSGGAGPLAQSEITDRLLHAGFRVVTPPAGTGGDQESMLRALRDDRGPPAADLLILGSADSSTSARLPVTFAGRTLSTVSVAQGRVEARAVRVETGEVVSSHVVNEVSTDAAENVAAGAAVEAAAGRVAAGFLNDLLVLPAGNARRVQVEVYGFRKRARAQALEDALPLVEGVRKVQRQDYVNGRLTLEVEVDSEAADRLGAALETSHPVREFGLTVETDTKARIRARVADRGEVVR